eukprot:Colp12_sorted_trinity150504_noHs@7367
MNLVGKNCGDLLFVNFNQDYTCMSVGTVHGYKVYNCEPFAKCYSKMEGGTGIVEMLFCTSLVALVGAGEQAAFSPKRLQIANTKRNYTICELNFTDMVLAVKLNRKRLLVVLEKKIHIYDMTTMKILHTLDTPPNPRGLCALSPNEENNYVAYPSSSTTGEVLIFDALNLQAVTKLPAHKTPVSAIAFNYTGTMLATSSDTGTIIRVFSVPEAKKLYQFRRGTKTALIHNITFNIQSNLLCVSSETDTIHIFKLQPIEQQEQQKSGYSGWYSMLPIPEAFSEMWEPQRDFAHIKLPEAGVQCICALSNTAPQVLVATAKGYFYQYNIDMENGGECALVKQYSFLDPNESKVENHPDVGVLPTESQQ